MFGVHDCMGQIREYDFDAVIGVGGIGQEPKSYGIDGKINWVGIHSQKTQLAPGYPSVVNFEYFVLLENEGPLLSSLAPNLANRIYNSSARFLLKSYTEKEKIEAKRIIDWALKDCKNQKMTRKNHNPKITNGCSKRGCSSMKAKKC